MKYNNRTLACILLVGCFALVNPARAEPTESYGEIVGRKLLSGLGNVVTSVAEIPKTIIIVNNESNIVWGLAGGSLKGLVNMIGRVGVGVLDLVTAPIPTYPIVDPLYVWDDFYAETTYGPAFVIEEGR
ncbi:exosortase system-associated protein, TIGR04073 family [Methylomonas sp. MgM2]